MSYRLILSAMVFLAACQPKQTVITESRRAAIVDSLVGLRMEEVARLAAEDLDRRRSIEVKAKSDSLVNAALGIDAAAPSETSTTEKLVTP